MYMCILFILFYSLNKVTKTTSKNKEIKNKMNDLLRKIIKSHYNNSKILPMLHILIYIDLKTEGDFNIVALSYWSHAVCTI